MHVIFRKVIAHLIAYLGEKSRNFVHLYNKFQVCKTINANNIQYNGSVNLSHRLYKIFEISMLSNKTPLKIYEIHCLGILSTLMVFTLFVHLSVFNF